MRQASIQPATVRSGSPGICVPMRASSAGDRLAMKAIDSVKRAKITKFALASKKPPEAAQGVTPRGVVPRSGGDRSGGADGKN